MTEKKELNQNELDEVTGGCGKPDPSQLPKDHGRELNQYETEDYIGQEVYILHKSDNKIWGKGILKESREIEVKMDLGTNRAYVIYFTLLSDAMFEQPQTYDLSKTYNTFEDSMVAASLYAIYLAN